MLWHKISDNMGIPISILKATMPYKEFRERCAYYAIQESNYSQTDLNIARLTLGYHNSHFDPKLEPSDVLDLSDVNDENEDEVECKEISLNVAQWHNLAKSGSEK